MPAEQSEAGPAEHLTVEHLDPVDVSFDDAGVPGEGESGDDGVEVAIAWADFVKKNCTLARAALLGRWVRLRSGAIPLACQGDGREPRAVIGGWITVGADEPPPGAGGEPEGLQA